jgi:hypothetical protein
LARGAAAVLLGLLVLIAAILAWRRAAGAMAVPLEPAALFLAAMVIGTCAGGSRLLGLFAAGSERAGSAPAASGLDMALAAAVSLLVLAIGLLVCLPGTTLAGRLLIWAVLVAEEAFTWRLTIGHARSATAPEPAAGFAGQLGNLSAGTSANVLDGSRPDDSLPAGIPSEEVLQQLTRSRAADGGELLSGWLRVPLAAGQRTANLHVAFCPPFARTPRVSVQQIDGPEARVKAVQTLPYGVRFDLKVVDEDVEASTLLLQFSAVVAPEADVPGDSDSS